MSACHYELVKLTNILIRLYKLKNNIITVGLIYAHVWHSKLIVWEWPALIALSTSLDIQSSRFEGASSADGYSAYGTPFYFLYGWTLSDQYKTWTPLEGRWISHSWPSGFKVCLLTLSRLKTVSLSSLGLLTQARLLVLLANSPLKLNGISKRVTSNNFLYVFLLKVYKISFLWAHFSETYE